MNVVPEIIEISKSYQVNMSTAYGGWWLSPSDSREMIKDGVTRDTDFVFIVNAVHDKISNQTLSTTTCDLTTSAAWNAIGTGYTWIPQTNPPKFFDCAERKTMIHGFLHQIDWDLQYLNGIGDIYNI